MQKLGTLCLLLQKVVQCETVTIYPLQCTIYSPWNYHYKQKMISLIKYNRAQKKQLLIYFLTSFLEETELHCFNLTVYKKHTIYHITSASTFHWKKAHKEKLCVCKVDPSSLYPAHLKTPLMRHNFICIKISHVRPGHLIICATVYCSSSAYNFEILRTLI